MLASYPLSRCYVSFALKPFTPLHTDVWRHSTFTLAWRCKVILRTLDGDFYMVLLWRKLRCYGALFWRTLLSRCQAKYLLRDGYDANWAVTLGYESLHRDYRLPDFHRGLFTSSRDYRMNRARFSFCVLPSLDLDVSQGGYSCTSISTGLISVLVICLAVIRLYA